jgi:hypothetical protein
VSSSSAASGINRQTTSFQLSYRLLIVTSNSPAVYPFYQLVFLN